VEPSKAIVVERSLPSCIFGFSEARSDQTADAAERTDCYQITSRLVISHPLIHYCEVPARNRT
jgi:hypothetical protein